MPRSTISSEDKRFLIEVENNGEGYEEVDEEMKEHHSEFKHQVKRELELALPIDPHVSIATSSTMMLGHISNYFITEIKRIT